ncbi:MAG: FkbM family methyltransferase [bacterium]|nr:MAG: FkbM family methyltransferase [bacterium]
MRYAQWLHPRETEKIIRQEVIDELRNFIKPGDVAIDIGAHTGDSTIPIALAAGREGCVLALEPNPYVFPVLKKNSELNADKYTIIPLMFAATPESGEYEFEYSDPGYCNGGLHEGISKWRHGHAFKLKVRGENLQSYINGNHKDLSPRIRFLKIDTEGYDHAVLVSLKDLISTHKPFIKVEFYKRLNRSQRERLYDLLVDFGYEVYRIEGETSYLGSKLEKRDLMEWTHYDAFCVPRKGALNENGSSTS